MQRSNRNDSVDRFVQRHNIERYRHLLQSDKLDRQQREAVLALLAQEEAKQAGEASPDGTENGEASTSP
jgi:hypothetical protein